MNICLSIILPKMHDDYLQNKKKITQITQTQLYSQISSIKQKSVLN